MTEQDPAQLAHEVDRQADEMDSQADEMQKRSEQLGGEVDEVRQDWERKRQDQGVPGAPAPEGDSAEDEGSSEGQDSPPGG
jgi:hypothetical protein